MAGTMKGRTRRWWWSVALVAGIAVLAALAGGCGRKSEQTATPPAGGEGAPAATEAALGGATPFNFHWDSTNNCLAYTPKADTLSIGTSINFNSSVDQTITITAPAGCFSAAETTFTVTRGGSPSMRGYSAGAYSLTITPTPCADVTGGIGPSVIINSGK